MSSSSGFLLVDKPEGISSFTVVRQLRKITGLKAIGHTGTLDPFASGLLICCLGACTRLAQYLEAESKVYEATCVFGHETDTGDTEGQIIQSAELPAKLPDPNQLTRAALSLQSLAVPAYSAVKIAGKRAYQYAREGIQTEIPDRETEISSFEIVELTRESLKYRCRVSKGTYIRSLSQWLARQCGTLGNTTELRRTAIGEISIEHATQLSELDSANWESQLKRAQDLLSSQASIIVSPSQATDLHHGKSIEFSGEACESIFVYSKEGALLSICSLQDKLLKPKQNFPYV